MTNNEYAKSISTIYFVRGTRPVVLELFSDYAIILPDEAAAEMTRQGIEFTRIDDVSYDPRRGSTAFRSGPAPRHYDENGKRVFRRTR